MASGLGYMTYLCIYYITTYSDLAGDDDRDFGGDEPGHLAGAGPQAAGGDHELRHGPLLAGKK